MYITAAQMQFFLNQTKGKEKFKAGDLEFVSYYKNCCLYNLVYDLMDLHPGCAKMYWDETNQCVALAFPMRGRVALALAEVAAFFGESGGEDLDEDEDTFGIFS